MSTTDKLFQAIFDVAVGLPEIADEVEKAESYAQSRLGKCQMEYKDGSGCEATSTSWCSDCNALTCKDHTTACCTTIRCEPCDQIHKTTHHEWLKRQPEFRK